jgi:hypothetical protein
MSQEDSFQNSVRFQRKGNWLWLILTNCGSFEKDNYDFFFGQGTLQMCCYIENK